MARRKEKALLFTLTTRTWLHNGLLTILLFGFTIACRSATDSTSAQLFSLAESQMQQGDLQNAFQNFNKLLLEFESLNNYKNASRALNNIGMIQARLERRGKARTSHSKALKYARLANDTILMAENLNNLGAILYKEGHLDSSNYYFNEAIYFFGQVNAYKRSTYVELNLGSILSQEGDFPLAIEHFSRCIKTNKKAQDTLVSIVAPMNLGIAYLNSDQNDSAISYLLRAEKQASTYNFPEYLQPALLNLGHAYYNSNQFKEAADYYDEYHLLKDSISGAKTTLEIHRLEQEFSLAKEKLEKNNAELETLHWQRIGIIGMSVLLLVIAIGVAFYKGRIAIQRAQTQAVLETREQENKRITDLLWKEIGISSKDKKLRLPGQELPEHTIPGAIAAARFLSNQQFNPYLPLGLDRAIEHLIANLSSGNQIKVTQELSAIKLDKHLNLSIYRALENLLVELFSDAKTAELKVTLRGNQEALEFNIAADHPLNQEHLRFQSAEARINSLKGKLKLSDSNKEIKVFIPIS